MIFYYDYNGSLRSPTIQTTHIWLAALAKTPHTKPHTPKPHTPNLTRQNPTRQTSHAKPHTPNLTH